MAKGEVLIKFRVLILLINNNYCINEPIFNASICINILRIVEIVKFRQSKLLGTPRQVF